MAEWKTQLSYNYHHAHGGIYGAAYGYGFMYHQPPAPDHHQSTGAAAAWTDPGLLVANLANYHHPHPGVTQSQASYYTAPAGTREASPPESPVIGHHHHPHHYPGSQQGVIQYFSNPQTGHIYGLPPQNRDPYEINAAARTHDAVAEAQAGSDTTRPATPASDSESHASPDSWSPRCSSRDGGLPQADPHAWSRRYLDGERDSVSPGDHKPTLHTDSWSSGLPQADPVSWTRRDLDGRRDSVSPDDPKPTLETDSWSSGLPQVDPVSWARRDLDGRRDSVSPGDPKPTLHTDSWSSGLPQADPVSWTRRDLDGRRDSVSPHDPKPTLDPDLWRSGCTARERGLPQEDPVGWTRRDLDGERDSISPDNPEPALDTDSWSSGCNARERGLPQADPTPWTRKDLDDGRDSVSPDTREQGPSLFTEKLNIPTNIGDADAPDPIHAPLSTPKKRGKRGKSAVKAARAKPNSKPRSSFSESQMDALMQRFHAQRYLTPAEMKELGEVTGLSYKQVKTWFQNRRMKLRRHMKDSDWVISSKGGQKTSPNASPNPTHDTNNIQAYQEEVFHAQLQEQYTQQMASAYNQSPSQNLAYYLAAMGAAGYSAWPSAASQPAGSPRPLPTGWTTLSPSGTHYEYSTATAGNSSGNTSIDSDDVVDVSSPSVHGANQ